MSKQSIEEAAEKYAYADVNKDIINALHLQDDLESCKHDFFNGALSDAAKEYWKEYWFEKFKLEYERLNASQFKAQEQKPVWVKASERLPDALKWRFIKVGIERNVAFYSEYHNAFIDSSENYYKIVDVIWLDESAMQPQLIDEEIERMAEQYACDCADPKCEKRRLFYQRLQSSITNKINNYVHRPDSNNQL